MDDISTSPATVSRTSNDTQSTSATSLNTNDLLIARARAMGVIPPAMARSDPQHDITPFCAHLWETETEMCRNVFDDEIPRPQPGNSITTKAEDDAYVERFFDRDTILVNGYRFLKIALIAISQYNHTQIVSCANEYFDNDKTNQELFQDAGTAQQMRTTTDITSFFDKKFIDDHNHHAFLTRVMQYIQCNFDHFKHTYGVTSLSKAATEQVATEQVTTTPAGSPGRSESTERALNADDGRMTPISEADVDFPASLEVPKSRNSQTPIFTAKIPGHNQAAAGTHVQSAIQDDVNKIPSPRQRHLSEAQPTDGGESQSSFQRDIQELDVEPKSSHGADSSSSRVDLGSTTPMHRHESRSSRELSAQKIKEFVPNQSRGHSSGSGRGYYATAPRYEQMEYYAQMSAYNGPPHPAEYVAYNTNQPQRNDQTRQNDRGRGGNSGRGRGRGQGSDSLHVLDHNDYQRLPAEAFRSPQNQAPLMPTAAERSRNWRQKENGPPTADARRTFSDQPLSAPYGFGTDPMQQHMPFLPSGSGPMRYAVTDRTNNPGELPRHPYGHMMPPLQERSVSDGSSLEGRIEDHVAISNIPDEATGDLVVRRVAEVLNDQSSQCQIVYRNQDHLLLQITPQAAWSLVLQQPRVVIHGRKLRFGPPPRPPPATREAMKRRYPNRDRSRHNAEQYSGETAPMPAFGPMQRNDRFRPDVPFNTGPSQHQPGSFRGRPLVPDVYQPNVAFAGAERQWGFNEPSAGQHVDGLDQSRGRPPRDLPGQNAGLSVKKNKKSSKKNLSPKKDQSPEKDAQRSGSYNDNGWLERTETIVPEDSVSLAGAPDVFSQSRDTSEQPPGEVDLGISAGVVRHKKVTSTSSIETVKQEVSSKHILTQPGSQSAPVGEELNSQPPQSSATLPVFSTVEQSPFQKAQLANETIGEEFLAGIQAAAREDDRRDTVHEALAAPKNQSSNAEGLVVQGTPKRNLTPREAGEDVDESFQTAHESPIEDKDDEAVPSTVVPEAAIAEPSAMSKPEDARPEKAQETQAQHGGSQNNDNQQEQSEQSNVSSKTAKKSDRPQELAAARPAKTESLSPFARQPKSKKKDKKPKPAKSKGKEESSAGTQAQSQAMSATKQTQNGSTAAGRETASSAAEDKPSGIDEAIKVDDKPAHEQDQMPGDYINQSERTSADILLQASATDSSVVKRSAAHDSSSTKSDSDHEMPFMDKGKGRMYPDQSVTTTTQITNDLMSSYNGKGKGKMVFDHAVTDHTREPQLHVSTVPDSEENLDDLDLTKQGDAAAPAFGVQQRSVSQLSNVTESTQSVPGEKPKSKKKKKNKKKKKAALTDATAADEQCVEPAVTTEDRGITNEDDSEEGDKIFTPPSSSVTDSPESKQGKTPRMVSSGLLQAPRNTLQLRKQKSPVKPRKVSDDATENEVETPKAGPSNILSKLGAKFGTQVEVINLSNSKAPAKSRPLSPSKSENQVNDSVRKMQELKHRENIAKLSKEPDEEARERGLRLEMERYGKECSKHEIDKLCNVEDSQAGAGATETANSSETVDYPETSATENNDNDRGLTPAQARFERDQEQERLRREELASYYDAKNKSIGRKWDQDCYKACQDPHLLDMCTPAGKYGGPVPIPTHPNPAPNFRDKMNEMFSKARELQGPSHEAREFPGPTHGWQDM